MVYQDYRYCSYVFHLSCMHCEHGAEMVITSEMLTDSYDPEGLERTAWDMLMRKLANS